MLAVKDTNTKPNVINLRTGNLFTVKMGMLHYGRTLQTAVHCAIAFDIGSYKTVNKVHQ